MIKWHCTSLFFIFTIFQSTLVYVQVPKVNMQTRYESMNIKFRNGNSSSSDYWLNILNINLGKSSFLPFQTNITSNYTTDPLTSNINKNNLWSMNAAWAEKSYVLNTAYNQNENFIQTEKQNILSLSKTKNLNLNFIMSEPRRPSLLLNYNSVNTDNEVLNYSQTKNENLQMGTQYNIGIISFSFNSSINNSKIKQLNSAINNHLENRNIGISFNKTLAPKLFMDNKYYLQSSEGRYEEPSFVRYTKTKTENINLDSGLTWNPINSITTSFNRSLQKANDKVTSESNEILTNTMRFQYTPSDYINLQLLSQYQKQTNKDNQSTKGENIILNLGVILDKQTNFYTTIVRSNFKSYTESANSSRFSSFKISTRLDKVTNFNLDYQKNETFTIINPTVATNLNLSLNSQILSEQNLSVFLTFLMSFNNSSSPASSVKNKIYSNSTTTSWQIDNKTSFLYNYVYNKNYGDTSGENFSSGFDLNKKIDNKTNFNIRYSQQQTKGFTAGRSTRNELFSKLIYNLHRNSQMSFEYKENKNDVGDIKSNKNLSVYFNSIF